jgi:hypothetical protein
MPTRGLTPEDGKAPVPGVDRVTQDGVYVSDTGSLGGKDARNIDRLRDGDERTDARHEAGRYEAAEAPPTP